MVLSKSSPTLLLGSPWVPGEPFTYNNPHTILLYKHLGMAYGIVFATLLLGSAVPGVSGYTYIYIYICII